VDEGPDRGMRRSSGSPWARARSLVQAATFFDVEPDVIADRLRSAGSSAGAVGLPPSWSVPASAFA
jgi:hypothetical protein